MPGWRPHCLRGSIYETQPINFRLPSEASVSIHDIEEDRRGVAVVELQKKEGCGLGLTVTGGSDKGCRAQISNLRAGSIAQRSDALVVGEYILSVNGIRTASLKHDEIINLLKNAGERITLEVEYEIPELSSSQANIQTRQWEVTLDKEGPGYGFTLRGGMKVENMRAFPLTIVAIRAGSSADRDGHVKIGDRVLQVNGYKVTHLTLTEMWSLLQQCGHQTTFSVAYDVAVMDAVEHASGPLLVEIDKTPGSALGIVLTQSSYQGKACVCVESIRPMSVADRSGALHVGDHILSIDGAGVEHMSVAEATQLLKSGTDNFVKLEILPVTHLEHCASREALSGKSLVPSLSFVTIPSMSPAPSMHNGICTMPSYSSHAASTSAIAHFATLSRGSRGSAISKYTWPGMDRKVNSCMSMVSTATSVRTANNQVCHSETTELMLFADHKGLGIVLEGGVFSTAILSHPPTIASIEPRSAADKCEVLQEGDRILHVNGVDTTERTLEEVNQFLRESRPRCVLEIEFDVAESVTPSCGTYAVKLAKKSGGTGITVGGRRKTTDPLVITDVRQGSAAHRCGSIQPGDKLLAINDVSLSTCTVDDATHLLELPDDIVKLKLQRDDPDEGNKNCITYIVQLQRHGGPLGITISGTEDPLDNIIISELTPGGLAQKTGAMHVGDLLLGINDSTTKNKPLSEAIRMLQSAGDTVTLKIARPLAADESKAKTTEFDDHSKRSTPIPSIDSAMESWDSMGHDMSGSSHAMVVAIPQHHRYSMDSSGHRQSRHSGAFDGSGEGMGHSNFSDDDDWADNENDNEDNFDCGQSHRSEASSVEVEDWVRTLGDLEDSAGSEMLRQISASLRERSTFSLDRRSNHSDSRHQLNQRAAEKRSKSTSHAKRTSKSQDALHRFEVKPKTKDSEPGGDQGRTFDQELQTIFTPTPIQLHRVTMEKTSAAADFGFSLSDGMYEKGVYVSAVRTGSPAQRAGLKTFDRVLQVNRHKTRDFDCRMTVPLIAEASNKLNMVICRNPLLRQPALRNSMDVDAMMLEEAKENTRGRNSHSDDLLKQHSGSGDVKSYKKDAQKAAVNSSGDSRKMEPLQAMGNVHHKETIKFAPAADSLKTQNSEGQRPLSALRSFQVREGRFLAGSTGDLNTQEGHKWGGEEEVDDKPGLRERNVQKASTLPGDCRVGSPSSFGSFGKPSGDGSKPAVAAKPKGPLGKPPISPPIGIEKPLVSLPVASKPPVPPPATAEKPSVSAPVRKPIAAEIPESAAIRKPNSSEIPKPTAAEKPSVAAPVKRPVPTETLESVFVEKPLVSTSATRPSEKHYVSTPLEKPVSTVVERRSVPVAVEKPVSIAFEKPVSVAVEKPVFIAVEKPVSVAVEKPPVTTPEDKSVLDYIEKLLVSTPVEKHVPTSVQKDSVAAATGKPSVSNLVEKPAVPAPAKKPLVSASVGKPPLCSPEADLVDTRPKSPPMKKPPAPAPLKKPAVKPPVSESPPGEKPSVGAAAVEEKPPVAVKTSVADAVARFNSARSAFNASRLESPGTVYGGVRGAKDKTSKNAR